MSDANPNPTPQPAAAVNPATPAANGSAPAVQSSKTPATPVAKVEPQSLLGIAVGNPGEPGKLGPEGATGHGNADPAAIEYKWTLPDTIAADDEGLKAFESLARESKLAPELAQKILDFDIQRQAAAMERYQAELAEQNKARIAELQADKEFGGAKFQETVALANKALTALGSPELLADLNAAGLGNHPGLIRLLAKAGKAMAEDRSLRGGGETKVHQRPADILYGQT